MTTPTIDAPLVVIDPVVLAVDENDDAGWHLACPNCWGEKAYRGPFPQIALCGTPITKGCENTPDNLHNRSCGHAQCLDCWQCGDCTACGAYICFCRGHMRWQAPR